MKTVMFARFIRNCVKSIYHVLEFKYCPTEKVLEYLNYTTRYNTGEGRGEAGRTGVAPIALSYFGRYASPNIASFRS